MKLWKGIKAIKLITVGTKVLLGVALVTNICIGALIYVNIRSAETVEKTVDDVLTIRENLSRNLREMIFKLQGDFLDLPAFFKISPQQTIIDNIKGLYNIVDERAFNGRSSYKSFFTRGERRDIGRGKILIQHNDEKIMVSYGLLDDEKNFKDTVVRLTLSPENPGQAVEELKLLVADLEQKESDANALRKKVQALNAMTADAGLEAEKTRTEIFQHVENITAKENLLKEIRQQQKDFTIYMGLFTVFANMLILFFLVRRIIERPLSTLTQTIDEIQKGNFREVPRVKRSDQIGVLAEAVHKFRQALIDIRDENERKAREKEIIDGTVQTTTTMIDTIESRAQKLVSLAENLQNLAETTGNQAEDVAHHAEDTARITDQVSDSAIQLEEVVETINKQVTSQNNLVGDIVGKNKTSQAHMEELGQAVKEIDGIIALVQDITEQTQLLALNATIEAARAGEAGKGFSVVATEMKELSTRTQRAASDVLNKVKAIKTAGETLTRNFNEIEGFLDNLKEATVRIREGIISQHSAVTTITGLASKTSTNTHKVSSTIHQVNQAAGETSYLSRKVHDYAEEIAGQLSVLLEETKLSLQQVQDQEEANPENRDIILLNKRSSRKPLAKAE